MIETYLFMDSSFVSSSFVKTGSEDFSFFLDLLVDFDVVGFFGGRVSYVNSE